MINFSKTHNQKKLLLIWLWSVLFSVLIMVVIGGITRLTDSGLSMVEWRPLLGILPPLSDDEWQRVFNLYKDSPEYIFYNSGMLLNDFKFIFFWEYFHRLFGRFIGLIFILPFLLFLFKGVIKKEYFFKLSIILILGILQGLIGWWMVLSGLNKDPDVSQYRLAAHFLNALLIMLLTLWLIMDISEGYSKLKCNFGLLVLLIIFITISAGTFVAGMNAGLSYNTYPLMDEKFFPDQYGSLGLLDPFENPGSAQFHHRHLGFIAFAFLIIFFLKNYKDYKIRFRLLCSLILCGAQFGIGIFILLNYIPLAFASLHQSIAVILILLLTSIIHTQNIKN